MKLKKVVILMTVLMVLLFHQSLYGCTNFLISKGASKDGSTMITYVCDSHEMYGELYYTPPGHHINGTKISIYEWDTGKLLGRIDQAEYTYSVVGNMNEYQVSIGETTWGGREELKNPEGIMDYGSLMYITLQRAKSAREAIRIMTGLTDKYGYCSSGETFSISDPDEVWIMEMIGKGPGNKGALWVARRVPDGYICAHANQARIRKFPLHKKEKCLYAQDVISFAREKGYFSGSDEEFSFADVFAPLTYGALRFCEARVYAMFNRAAPLLNLSMDFVKGKTGSEPIPLWIKPDRKLSVHDVMELMRDHFEGTDFDMTRDIGAGPYRLPYRWRPLTWEIDSVRYCNERATSTQQTGFSFIAQARSWLPDAIGGILWFGVDDTYSTVYVPMYCCIKEIPLCYAEGHGSFDEFSWDSAFWVFNFVSNYAYSRYSEMIKDIQVVQRELEGLFLSDQKEIEDAALSLYKNSPKLAKDYLTDYSVKAGNSTVQRWKKLGEGLMVKYLDGNVKDELGNVTHPGYPEQWYREIVKETGDHYEMKELKK